MARYDFILFDADGTLFDFDKAEKQALRRLMRHCGLAFSELIYQTYHRINQLQWKAFEKGELTKEQLQYRRFQKLFEWLGAKEDVAGTNDFFLCELAKGAFLLPGAVEICQTLYQQCRLDVVTNGVERVQKSRFAASPLQPYFSSVFVSEAIGVPKPDRAYFDFVFAAIPQFDPTRAVLVGDSLSSDMRGGINAGIAVCWFNPDHRPNDTGLHLDYEIESLEQLSAIVL